MSPFPLITTTYAYSSATGDLTGVTYNDGVTPAVSFTYDRLGRQKTIDDALGTREFAYGQDLQPDTEDIGTEMGDLYSKLITRKYQTTAGSNSMPGRAAGFSIGSSGDPDADYDTTYGYWGNGRIESVLGPGLGSSGARYDYVGSSNLVWKIRQTSLITTQVSTVFTYEANRDLVESVEHIRHPDDPDTTIAKYAYVNDAVGRRTAVGNSGEAFAADAFTLWGYNTRSELTSSKRYHGTYDPTPDPGDEVTAERRLFNYDPIGNRTDSTEGAGSTVYYCANALNQYLTLDDTDDTCPQSPADESFTYDADGNLTQDGTFTYTWDGENRLIGLEPSSPVNGDKKLTFKYDYMNRRVEKKVWTYSSGWGSPTEILRFVYDRWNVVLVLDGLNSNAILRKYTWGLDLSGLRGNPTLEGIHGAGGIGGLLAVQETGGTYAGSYWFLYDANGNVTQLIENTTNYPLAAHYEYDAYGNVLGTPTSYAFANPFRFSTKWFDRESDLGYWGERYYILRLSRWLSTDLLGELGGLNLYNSFRNNPINQSDPLGMACGPGPVGDWFVPDLSGWNFDQCCQDHDDCYGDCKGPSKERCDENFLNCMVDQCRKLVPGQRNGCLFIAGAYYRGVDWGGAGSFKAARRGCCSQDSGAPLCPADKKPCYTGCASPMFECAPPDADCRDYYKSPFECLNVPGLP